VNEKIENLSSIWEEDDSENQSQNISLIPASEFLFSLSEENEDEKNEENTFNNFENEIDSFALSKIKENLRKELEVEIRKELEKEFEEKLNQILNEKISALTNYYETKLKEVQEESYKQGFEEGYKKGFEDGKKSIEKEYREKLNKLREFIKNFEKLLNEDIKKELKKSKEKLLQIYKDILEELLISSIEFIIQEEYKKDCGIVMNNILKTIKDFELEDYAKVQIFVNPIAFKILDKARFLMESDHYQILEDKNLDIGDFRIKTQDFEVESIVKERLNVVKEELKETIKQIQTLQDSWENN